MQLNIRNKLLLAFAAVLILTGLIGMLGIKPMLQKYHLGPAGARLGSTLANE
jgi:hypothetical protein